MELRIKRMKDRNLVNEHFKKKKAGITIRMNSFVEHLWSNLWSDRCRGSQGHDALSCLRWVKWRVRKLLLLSCHWSVLYSTWIRTKQAALSTSSSTKEKWVNPQVEFIPIHTMRYWRSGYGGWRPLTSDWKKYWVPLPLIRRYEYVDAKDLCLLCPNEHYFAMWCQSK